MLARGYRGELLTLAPHAMRPLDWTALLLSLIFIAALQLIPRI
jgi:energy-coupling factor transporter transmembrane protein EcfT